jgi:GAF domain-containing protein
MKHLEKFRDDELSVIISELLVATADSSDPLLDDSVSELLHAMRTRMEMVFVSEFIDGRRMFRYVDAAPGAPAIEAGASNPLEESVCQRVVEGRVPELVQDLSAMSMAQAGLPELPFQIGAHLSTPIVLKDRRVYGTLCCFSAAPRPDLVQADLHKLKLCATLVARKVDLNQTRGVVEPPPDWQLEPMDTYESPAWQKASRRGGRG